MNALKKCFLCSGIAALVAATAFWSCSSPTLTDDQAVMADKPELAVAPGGPVATINSSSKDAYEEDDYRTSAKAIAVNGAVQERNYYDDANDWMYFNATGGTKYTIESWTSGTADTYLYLYGVSTTTVLAKNDDKAVGNRGSLIAWTAPSSGTFYVKSYSYNGRTGTNRNYTVSVKSDDGPPQTDVINYDPSNPVVPITFTSGQSSKTVTIKGASGKSVYMVKANVDPASVIASGTGGSSSAFGGDDPIPPLDMGEIVRMDYEPATRFNSMASKIPSAPMKSVRASSVAYGDPTGAGYVAGTTTKAFWVQDKNEAWIQVTATLRAIGRYCYVWVPAENWSSSSTTADNKLSQARVNEMVAAFDGTSAGSYKDGIFGYDTNMFGYEIGGGPGGNGGRDSDQHVSILLYDIDYDFTSTQTGGVLGYFWGKDYYSQSELSGYDIKTNYCEMFYVDVHFADGWPKMIYSTLAHEYQHMIHFAQKSIGKNLDTATWFNEMCSMVAEDGISDQLGISNDYSPIGRLEDFCQSYYLSGVYDWLSGNDVLKSYASAYAFGAYLVRNYGGAKLFNAIGTNAYADAESVQEAVRAQGYQLAFNDIFREYAEAMVFNPTANSVVKSFNVSLASPLNGVTYKYRPIDLYSMSNGNGGYGPVTFNPSTQQILRPYGFSIHQGTAWKSVSGDLNVTLTKPSASTVEFMIMIK